MIDVRYLPASGEIEVVNDMGFPTYYSVDSLIQVDADERALGTQTEYMTEDGLHLTFYPEGKLSDWWVEEKIKTQ